MCLSTFELIGYSAFFCGDEAAGEDAFALAPDGDEGYAAAILRKHHSNGHMCRPVIENAARAFDRVGINGMVGAMDGAA